MRWQTSFHLKTTSNIPSNYHLFLFRQKIDKYSLEGNENITNLLSNPPKNIFPEGLTDG